jgi:poly(3-hydroxybutyrate) depolymerase
MKKTRVTTIFLAACSPQDAATTIAEPLEFRVGPSSGCDNPHNTSGTFQVDVGGVMRNYRIDAPPGWDGTTPIPVVYTFHACGANEQNGSWNSLYSRTNQAQWLAPDLSPYPVLVVAGDSAGTCWDVAPSAADLPYYDAMRAVVESNYCIDDERRYHAGVSSGGFAAQAFACRRDGVAAVWAGLSGMHHAVNPYGVTPHPMPEVGECNGPVPVMAMASTNDTIVPPNTYTRPARDRWLEINGCAAGSGVPYTHRVPAADPAAGGAPNGNSCTSQIDCACLEYTCTGARTVWCEYTGTGANGHSWPIYYRDSAANWLGRFIEQPDETSSSSGNESSSTVSSEDGSSTCEMVCQCL